MFNEKGFDGEGGTEMTGGKGRERARGRRLEENLMVIACVLFAVVVVV